MTKTDLIEIISKRIDLRKFEIQNVIDSFLDEIVKSTLSKKSVQIRGFGTFNRVEKKARKIHSPIKKGIIEVPAKSTIGFKASKSTEKLFL